MILDRIIDGKEYMLIVQTKINIRAATIDEKKESHLIQFGHVQKRLINVLVRKNDFIQVEEMKRDSMLLNRTK